MTAHAMPAQFIPSSCSGVAHSLSGAPGALSTFRTLPELFVRRSWIFVAPDIIRMILPSRLCGLGLFYTPDAVLHISPATASGLTTFQALLPPSAWIPPSTRRA
jgi:hypothetical protein